MRRGCCAGFLWWTFIAVLAGCPSAPGAPDAGPGDGRWRSALYPADWTPAHTGDRGRFLHDFSYAGYHRGERPLPASLPGARFDVVAQYGADSTGAADATAAIQAAIDAASAAGGGVVRLPAGLYRCDGLLRVSSSRVVLQGDGPVASKLYFTRSSGMTDRAHLTFQGSVTRGVDLPLSTGAEARSVEVTLATAASLAAGDEVALGWRISDAFVAEHGMTGTWTAFADQWKPFFRREVRELDVATGRVTLDVPTRYPAKLRDGASLRRESGYLEECGVEELGLANAVDWNGAWAELRVHALLLDSVKDCWVRNVASFAPPTAGAAGYHLQNGGVKVLASKRVTLAGVTMEKAQNRGGGGCGYLFELSASGEVLVRDCAARAGRHNFIQNWDFGTTGCVFLRIDSADGHMQPNRDSPNLAPGFSEYHHSLATACLVDQATLSDGFLARNRGLESTGAGHTATQSVFWNSGGEGILESHQFGWGYVIGTSGLAVNSSLFGLGEEGTAPRDHLEGLDAGALLEPPSLYEDQLARRLGR